MHTILTVIVSVFQMLYQAQVSTFGCSSSAEVAELQGIRSNQEAFEKLLYTQVVYGQCITIAKGAVVEGTNAAADSTVLVINLQSDPPGYLVPRGDFELVKPDGKQ